MLGHGIVDGDHREVEHLIRSHGAETDHAGCRFFRAADNIFQKFAAVFVNRRDEIRSIIHGHLRFVIERRVDVFVIRYVVFTFDGIRGNLIHVDQRRGNIILCG